MPTHIEELPAEWPATRLDSLDRGGTGVFALRLGPPEFWLLEQGGKPVGMIKRADAGTWLRTAAEEWRMGILRRRRRLRWQLVFAPTDDKEPVIGYSPRTLRPGGGLTVLAGTRYNLRAPLLRADWRLVAATGGEVARIAFRGDRQVQRDFSKRVGLSSQAQDEPLLALLLLAAGAAILVHHYDVRPWAGGSI